MYSLSIKIDSALWPNMVVSIFETYWYRKIFLKNCLYAIAIAILFKSMFCHILKTCNQFYSKSHVNQLVLNTCICTNVHVYLNIWKVSFKSDIKMSFFEKS
jgi:hypothetical protein